MQKISSPTIIFTRTLLLGVALLFTAMLLAACSSGPLLGSVEASAKSFAPAESDQPLTVSYRIGRDATVDVYLLDAADTRYDLRRNQPRSSSPNPYVLRFDGTVPTSDPVVLRRLLPPGDYTLVVAAQASGGAAEERRVSLTITGSELPIPDVQNLLISPQTISPNADAVDDVTEITYRLPVSATIDID
ncbi:MAG: hypothetical protein HGA65_19765, partial [Oscillochloris sp.]|nr:hypothetical protein [Oscillochloris sp.]